MKYQPMLASPMKKGRDAVTTWTDWAIEEKYDGHRLLIEVDSVLIADSDEFVTAWARPHGDGAVLRRELPDHLVKALRKLAPGVYDGELLGGDTGTDVTRKDLAHERRIVLFDVLEHKSTPTTGVAYGQRHAVLQLVYEKSRLRPGDGVTVAESVVVKSEATVTRFVQAVWAAGGEGAILKRLVSRYQQKRSKDWIKIKRVEHAILEVVGFEATRGAVLNRGAFAVVKLRDADGNETTVKTKNDEELAALTNATAHSRQGFTDSHPALGRRLVIEYPRRTRTGGYQGPVRWDRWAEEGETL